MHPDVEALLAVQTDDVAIHEVESKLAQLAPRLVQMQQEIDHASGRVLQARQAIEGEERRQRDVQGRVAQHRQLQERNQAQLNNIADARQATAAMAQLDQSKRMIDDDERELHQLGAKINEYRRTLSDLERELRAREEAQADARQALDADAAELRRQLDELRAGRAEKAARVPRPLLSRYDRIAKRHKNAVVALRGQSCGNCDTTLPLQRRAAMAGSGATEICEGCGVMLYAAE